MSILTHPHLRAASFFCFAAVALASLTQASDTRPENPTSKLYVADIEGLASITVGGKIEDLVEQSAYTAEGVVVETAPESNNSIVLSNGTGIAFGPDSRLEIRRFIQEPFAPDRTDLDVEPSVSQTTAFLPRGDVSLCTSKMVAGSTMTYATRHGSVTIRGRKVVIETNDTRTVVSLIEGDVTVHGELLTGGQPLVPGQQAIITRDSNFEPPTITIQPIPKDDMKRLVDKVSIACMARKTVHFDVVRGANPDDEPTIVPVEVLPGTLDPQITISPYNIPAPAKP